MRPTVSAASTTTHSETTLYGSATNRRVTIRDLQLAKDRGERWPMLTAYDYSTARVFDEAGIPVLLVGDSAANVVYGYDTTVPVTTDELLPLVRGVVRGTKRALVVADKSKRVHNYHRNTVKALGEMLASAGLSHPSEIKPWHIHVRSTTGEVVRGDVAYPHVLPGALLSGDVEERLLREWKRASADSFQPLF